MPARRPPDPEIEIRRFTPDGAAKAIGLLQTRYSEVQALDPRQVPHNDARVRVAELHIQRTILEVFGERSLEFDAHRYHRIQHGHARIGQGYNSSLDYQRQFAGGIPATLTMLEALIDTVKERTDQIPMVAVTEAAEAATVKRTVFVVHGRAEGVRDAVARFVTQLGLEPVILQEQASEGKTIIEKFEKHADVGYAVVLLTGDDRGGLANNDPGTYASRARQNVILELGYFVGKLGRSHVCVLHEQGVEIPSDFHGVVYVALDAGGAWKLTLAKEMKVAGLNVDLNRAL